MRAVAKEAAALGKYDVTLSPVHVRALKQLVSEATAAGSRVILHTLPGTDVYREVNAEHGGTEALCKLRRELRSKPDPILSGSS